MTGTATLRCLTFEVSGSQRRGARPARCRINHRSARAWRLAVGSPLDRGVRHRHSDPISNATEVAVRQIQVRNARRTKETDTVGYGAPNASSSNALWFSTLPPESRTVDEASPLGRAVWRQDGRLGKRCLTFEVSGRRRRDASARAVKMYRVPPAGRWWPAVGAPLDRGVRRHRWTANVAPSRFTETSGSRPF